MLNRLVFSQASKLIEIGRSRIVEASDKLELPAHLSPYTELENGHLLNFSSAKTLFYSLFKVQKKILTKAISFQIIGSLFSFSTPVLIHLFITELQKNDWSQAHLLQLILLAIGFGLCGAGNGIAIQHYFYNTLNFFQMTTNEMNKRIFKHALQLSAEGKQQYQVGDIVNFMSTDADALGDGAITTIDLANASVLLIGCSSLLFYYIGWSAVVAVLVLAVLIPLTQKLAKKFVHLEEEMMSHRDRRMTLMTQVMNSVRVIKYFSWEKSVAEEVKAIRDKEIGARFKLTKSEISWGLLYASVSTVVLFVALITHHLRGQKIDLALVLTCISIFSLMEDHFGGLSRFISRFMNIFVSGQRIIDFLNSKSIQKFHLKQSEQIDFKQIHFQYPKSNESVFSQLSFHIKKGESLAVVGAVGSGKSTLLSLFLEEQAPQSGQIYIPSDWKKAFVSQEAFIVNSTLKENILFGQMASSEQINNAIQLCSLATDLQILPKGLDTEIGEKGVNLSGGQKQRVSLARAVLSQPDFILLDDPLSAVDQRTEIELCENLIFGLWKDKTRIMATHRISQLEKFDKVLFLAQQGKFYFGSYNELLQQSDEFNNFLAIEKQNQSHELHLAVAGDTASKNETSVHKDGRVTVDEDRETGSVKKDIYWSYVKALGGDSRWNKFFIFLLFSGAIVHVASPMLQKAWLTQKSSSVEPLILVLGYGGFGLLTLALGFANNYWWSYRGVQAGQLFHQRMLQSVLKSQIRFFDSTPIGRILQRFSRDIESVDIHLQWSFDSAIHSLFSVVLSFLLIVFALPLSLIILVPVLFVYYHIQNSYRRVAREVKRLDSLARSPRYAHFKETLTGLPVIRSFQVEEWFWSEFLKKLHYSTEMFYSHYMVNRWFSSRLPLVGASISMTTALAVVVATSQSWISLGLAGLATLYSLEFWRHLNWGVRIFSDLESRMTSVERLQFYSDLPAEQDLVDLTEFRKKHPYWPNSGQLEFKNVFLKYAEHLPLVLKGINFIIESGHRAGIIGRTGSGKSTLFQAVYRFTAVAQGEILLDQVPIHEIPLELLRQQLAVIPQDPSLFMGSLRSNLDRYLQASDAEIWTVLEQVGLKKFVQELPQQLQFQVTENGANLSQGQRQLICLARALLMKVKVIFLDEATASVDLETDALIQKVISESLKGITLVTIAHRLSTLKGYHQIIELQDGRVIRDSNLKVELI